MFQLQSVPILWNISAHLYTVYGENDTLPCQGTTFNGYCKDISRNGVSLDCVVADKCDNEVVSDDDSISVSQLWWFPLDDY